MSNEKKEYRGAWDLDVFQKAYVLSLEVHRQSLAWPKTEQYSGVADQIRRSSKGICANLLEGYARGISDKDFCHFVSMAMGSSAETKLWSTYASDLGFMEKALAEDWKGKWSEIERMLAGLRKKYSPVKS